MIDVLFNPDKFFRERKDISLWICAVIVALNGVIGSFIAFKSTGFRVFLGAKVTSSGVSR